TCCCHMTQEILILYYSRHGSTRELASEVARGISRVDGMAARVRTVPPITTTIDATAPEIPDTGAPYFEPDDQEECVGLILGSPTRFGNMFAPLMYFLVSLAGQWLSGTLAGKPGAVFPSTGSMHGGQ